jgi:hypothetical protein
MTMTEQGTPLSQIREYVDATYQGAPTHTPLSPAA